MERRLQFSAPALDGTVTPGADTLPAVAFDLSADATATIDGAALAQTLTISEGVHTYATLPDATVTMTGTSELHVTAAANPVPGSTIHLNAPGAWFWLDNVKPSVVNSTYLSQVRVNGAAAVHGATVRVVQYGLGTVVIPHAPSFRPLLAFTGPNFTGASQTFGQYTYHNTPGSLGQMNRNISSFRLKRGYMATIATQPNGSGISKVYVAQDHDLDVALLPSNLDNQAQFVRVFPWRWVSKKGASDLSPTTLNASWYYNWDNNQNSPLDAEYVPIKQQRWWPAYPTNKPDSTHLLGFNEPNNPVEDAYESLNNGDVDAAIAVWPELLASGLRVGSPAVTDGGKAWLYEFMDKAIAANLRVDYIAIHNYQAGNTGASLKSWLQDIYNRYHLPIWLTEFNNGANWTGGADPTLEQNAQRIGEFIDMMDTTPWIERYSIYSRVEAVREMTYADGSLTPAGQVYYNNASPIGYVQESVPGAGRGIAQLPLDGNTLDTSGHGNNGQAVGAPAYVAGQRGQAIQLDGANSYVRLTDNVASGDAFSFAGWVNWDGGANWQRLFDFGTGTSSYLFLTPSNGTNMRFAIKNGGGEQIVQTAPLPVGQWTHVALTLGGGVARLYVNGSQVATNGAVTIKPSDFDPTLNYLGESQFAADPLFKGRLDDVIIRDAVLTPAQIAGLMNNAPPQFAAGTISAGVARPGVPFSGTIAGSATDPDSGDTITYGKASGPAWLTVASNGTFSGTPTSAEQLPQEFVVTATDSKGASASAILAVSENRGIAQLPLDGNALDTSGYANHGQPVGPPAYVAGQRGQALALDGTNNYLQLPVNLAHGDAFSFAGWVNWDGGGNWQRIFDFGVGTSAYLFLAPSGGSNMRFAIKNGGPEQIVETSALPVGQWTHVALTLGGGVARLYVNGSQVATNAAVTIKPSDFDPTLNYIGKSQYSADPLFKGRIDDVLVADYVLTPAQIAAAMSGGGTPTLGSPASATPNPVTGTTAALAVLGADDAGEPGLTYTWSVGSKPGGAPDPTFTVNGTNAAKNTTATFTRAGAYTFVVTVRDGGGLTTTGSVNVTVNPALGSITVTPPTPTVEANGTQQFTAAAFDQFGQAMSTPPTFTWSVISGGGTINSSGLYTAPGTAGTATVRAASGGVAGTVNVTVVPPALPAWLAPGSAATWDASARSLAVTGAAAIIADPGADAPVVTASGSAAVLQINPVAGSPMNLGGLHLSNGAVATVNAEGAERVLVIADGARFTMDATATLDLADNALVVRNAGQSAAFATHASANDLVRAAFNEFAWNQPGITSTTAAADVAGGTPSTLGVLLNNDGAGGPLFYGDGTDLPAFMGSGVDANTWMVRYTRLGDGDLNGVVDSVDFALFQAGYTGAAPFVGFAFGDYDYNGAIDSVDFGLFQAGYQAGVGAGAGAAAQHEGDEGKLVDAVLQ